MTTTQNGADAYRCLQLESEGQPPSFVRDATADEWAQAAALGRPMPVAKFEGDLDGGVVPTAVAPRLQVRVELTLPMRRFRCGDAPLRRVVLGSDTIDDVLLDPDEHDNDPIA